MKYLNSAGFFCDLPHFTPCLVLKSRIKLVVLNTVWHVCHCVANAKVLVHVRSASNCDHFFTVDVSDEDDCQSLIIWKLPIQSRYLSWGFEDPLITVWITRVHLQFCPSDSSVSSVLGHRAVRLNLQPRDFELCWRFPIRISKNFSPLTFSSSQSSCPCC